MTVVQTLAAERRRLIEEAKAELDRVLMAMEEGAVDGEIDAGMAHAGLLMVQARGVSRRCGVQMALEAVGLEASLRRAGDDSPVVAVSQGGEVER
jgi:hypothetical protein